MSSPEPDRDFEALLEFLKQERGFDFTGYKRASLQRRVDRRRESAGMANYGDYLDHLQVDTNEFTRLFNTILINVTTFFRDPPIWEYLAEDVVPRIIKGKDDREPIRAWCAGCASGQETYTMAMILAEALGPERFAERVKIYATDVDEEALAQARQAVYSDKEVEGVPDDLGERYFEPTPAGHAFSPRLRRSIIFGRHDLVQDAPISRIDLLCCRNTLMYLNAETQARVISKFHFALSKGGYLVLGKAELLFTQVEAFTPVDRRRRVFQRASTADLREALLGRAEDAIGDLAGLAQLSPDASTEREEAFERSPMAQVVVDRGGAMVLANDRARSLLGVSPADVGRRFADLEASHRPVDLRPLIDRAYEAREAVTGREAEWRTGLGDPRQVRVHAVPLLDAQTEPLGIGIWFEDVTRQRELEEGLRNANQELETAMEELQSTNEELETTNEELQSTNEELETTNEELQATNEELETMNEELQSTNEELHSVNEDLRRRESALDRANSFLEAILTGVQAGVVVLDGSLRVEAWNAAATDLWGLRSEEVIGSPFLNLDIGLPVELLKQPLLAALAGTDGQSLTLEATNRRGRGIMCRVACTPLRGGDAELRGAILLMEEIRSEEST